MDAARNRSPVRAVNDRQSLVVTIDDAVVARGEDLAGLAATTTLDGKTWTAIAAGSRIRLEPMPSAKGVTALFVPDEHTAVELEGCVGQGEVVDVGVTVNGECWGWALGQMSGSYLLLPCDFERRAASVFSFSASQELSLTGATITVVCRTLAGVTVATRSDGIDGPIWLETTYGNDVAQLVERAARVAFDWPTIDSFCPLCMREQGWVMSVEVQASIEPAVVQALDRCWRPCYTHLAAASEGVELIGLTIRWMDDRWERAA